ncbi:MAG: hypothetical protein RML36_08560 [Anaerolineae bacterium]|nr:hypothetical protein [Anaerolineae bacterium]MDW8099516.1 hypothetical protein [Anaerolineae bacterium]
MLPVAYVSHELAGRLRIRIPERKRDKEYLTWVSQVLSRAEGVIAIEVNPLTGSLLIRHRSTTAELLRFAQEQQLFALEAPDTGQERLLNLAAEGVGKLEDLVHRVTQGQTSLNEVLFVTLVGLAGLQALRGHALGPSTALLSYAAGILALHRANSRAQ